MTTQQIITLTAICIIFWISLSYAIITKKEIVKYFLYFISLFMFALVLVITITSAMELNYLRSIIKNKCPEYEKVENVYKLVK